MRCGKCGLVVDGPCPTCEARDIESNKRPKPMTLEEALREAEALSWKEGGTTPVVKLRKVKELLRKVYGQ